MALDGHEDRKDPWTYQLQAHYNRRSGSVCQVADGPFRIVSPRAPRRINRVYRGFLTADGLATGVTANRVLTVVSHDQAERLANRVERLTLRSNDVIFEPSDPAQYVYFPETAVISLQTTMEDGRTAEVNLTGAEGFVGVGGFLGAPTCGYTALVEIAGSCLRMETEAFKAACSHRNPLETRSLAYLRYLIAETSQVAACNRLHRVSQRLARRLLMMQDRVHKNAFPLTHESLSYALGTPRSEVSFAAEGLRRLGMIDYARGKVTIVNRDLLESFSCECYAIIHREYEALG